VNLAKELNINVNEMTSCYFINNNKSVDIDIKNSKKSDESHIFDIKLIKEAFNQMNNCYYKQLFYVYNNQYQIHIILKNDAKIILALSNDKKYIGKPTRASGISTWYYLLDNGNEFNPFGQL
jgi:hypothetical protein